MRGIACGVASLLIGVMGWCAVGGGEPARSSVETKPFGLTQRVPWVTAHVRGRPEPPPPLRAEPLYSRIRFRHTTLIATAPGTDRVFVGERTGKIHVLPSDRTAEKADLFLDCQDLISRHNRDAKSAAVFESVYGLAFDPDYVKNGYCYVCYVMRNRDRAAGPADNGTRVVRLKVLNHLGAQDTVPRCDIESEQLILSWLGGGHNGGCLRFGLDGNLYISSGDGGVAFPPDGLRSGQDLSTLLAKVLRIDVRRSEGGRPYAIPADNPFIKLEGARPETWAYGLRNPWKMSFDRKTGELWVGDVGWELWELVFNVRPGDNFGWSIVEGSQPVHSEGKRGPTPIVPATMEIPHTEGASITGGFVYRGKKFPEFVGHYIFGDWETRRIWSAKVVDGKLAPRVELIDPIVRIVDFAEDADGELYLLDHDDGTIYTLSRNVVTAATNPFPRKLSETGLFVETKQHAVAPGVIPFSVNAEQWSDHAIAERLLGVPGTGAITIRNKATEIPGSMFSRATDYPKDTVLLKTLSLEMKAGDPSSRRRVESQLLHFDGREFQGYTYEWNDEQTDAVLVERGGKSRTFTVADPQAPGGKRQQTWQFAARGECIRCHNPWSEYTLAFNIPQINREHDYHGVRDNQIRALRHVGVLVDEPDRELPPALRGRLREPGEMPRLAQPFDPSGDVGERARAYLHVNCSHCHRFNGGGSSYIYLQHELSLKETKAVGVRPTQGTFGIHDAQLVAAGDPHRSVLYFRLSKTGPGHMPHLGAKLVDERALSLIHDWIRQLPPRTEDAFKLARLIELEEGLAAEKDRHDLPVTAWKIARRVAKVAGRDEPNADDVTEGESQANRQLKGAVRQRDEERRKLVGELLGTPTGGLVLVEAYRQKRLADSLRGLVLEQALAVSTDPAIRDLFEVFVPESQRTQRLGESINPAELLKLAGDAERGKKLWHESTVVQCRNCHRIAGKGVDLGPDLDSIGKKYDRVKLLESILQPSLHIDPKYEMWLVETKAGRVHAGFKLRQNDKEIVIRDNQNKQHTVAMEEVDGVFRQAKSMMPEHLFRDFTATQAADLLAYLATLRADPPPMNKP